MCPKGTPGTWTISSPPILCAGLRRFLTLKLEHIPADKFVMDPHSKLMELTNNFPAWPENLADETCAYENKVKKRHPPFCQILQRPSYK